MSERTVAGNLAAIHVEAFMIEAADKVETIKARAENIHTFAAEIEEQLGIADKHRDLMKLTAMLDEHPEGWSGDCACRECMSTES